jgi:antitoxin component of MazEF toxin-antitoxin module
MYKHLIVRAHRQHNSIVMTVPKMVCTHLGIEAGDYLVVSFSEGSHSVQVDKFVGKDGKDARGKRCADRKDQGRRKRAASRRKR